MFYFTTVIVLGGIIILCLALTDKIPKVIILKSDIFECTLLQNQDNQLLHLLIIK
jgi:hypothetical protein